VDVSALSFDVSCHPITGLPIEFWEDGSVNFEELNLPFTLLGRPRELLLRETDSIIIDLYNLNMVRGGDIVSDYRPYHDQLVVFSAIAIRNGDGSLAGETIFPSNQTFRPYNASSVQVIGCDLDLEIGTLKVNPQSKTPVANAVFQGTGIIYTIDEAAQTRRDLEEDILPWWRSILFDVCVRSIYCQ
jgi:hypothetical protein